jgi:toxin YoeB
MSKLIFLPEAWEDYLYWQKQDKKTLLRINLLLQDISRNAFDGLGKPEPLRGNLTGWYSRHIDDANRLVYRVQGDDNIEIAQCRGHYRDK